MSDYPDNCPNAGKYETGFLAYTPECAGCKMIVKIGKRLFCGYVPPRCALHQVIRGQLEVAANDRLKSCLFCNYYSNKIDSARCLECMETNDFGLFVEGADHDQN